MPPAFREQPGGRRSRTERFPFVPPEIISRRCPSRKTRDYVGRLPAWKFRASIRPVCLHFPRTSAGLGKIGVMGHEPVLTVTPEYDSERRIYTTEIFHLWCRRAPKKNEKVNPQGDEFERRFPVDSLAGFKDGVLCNSVFANVYDNRSVGGERGFAHQVLPNWLSHRAEFQQGRLASGRSRPLVHRTSPNQAHGKIAELRRIYACRTA